MNPYSFGIDEMFNLIFPGRYMCNIKNSLRKLSEIEYYFSSFYDEEFTVETFPLLKDHMLKYEDDNNKEWFKEVKRNMDAGDGIRINDVTVISFKKYLLDKRFLQDNKNRFRFKGLNNYVKKDGLLKANYKIYPDKELRYSVALEGYHYDAIKDKVFLKALHVIRNLWCEYGIDNFSFQNDDLNAYYNCLTGSDLEIIIQYLEDKLFNV
jgi:hypothetical protein